MPRDGRVSARAFASKSTHGRLEIRLTKTCGELTAPPNICWASRDTTEKLMRMYSYDQVLTDVKDVYEQLTGLPAPDIDIKKPRFPLPKGVNPVGLVQSEI